MYLSLLLDIIVPLSYLSLSLSLPLSLSPSLSPSRTRSPP